jgi:hypothetical protein
MVAAAVIAVASGRRHPLALTMQRVLQRIRG